MRKWLLIGLAVVGCHAVASAERTKTVYNPFTSKSDYITKIDTNTIKAGTGVTVTSGTGGVVTISASGGSGGGIVSPGTFTWVNNFGMSLSTVTVSTFTASSGTVAGKFIVTTSSVVVNESGAPCNVNPGLVDICKNVQATNKPLFSIGTNLQSDQLVIYDQLRPEFRYGIGPGGLIVADPALGNQLIASNQSGNQRIDFWNSGVMEIQTASTGDGGSYIVIEPQNTEAVRITSTGGTIFTSSATFNHTNGIKTSSFTVTTGGLAGRAVCWKTDQTLSYCTSVVGVNGDCTCN